MNKATVLVIGAGPSGLAAATKLLDLGFKNVTLIEAEDRIGGRINTIPFADNVIDLGAQWCHGEEDNVVYKMAYLENLLEHSEEIDTNHECIRSNKEVVPEKVCDRLQDIIDDWKNNHVSELSNFKGSLGWFITSKYFEALQRSENSDIDKSIAEEYLEKAKKFECDNESADSLDDLSARDFYEFSECKGDQEMIWKDKGYKRFLQLLIQSVEGNELGVLSERVKFGKTVQKITWDNSNRAVQVKCVDGEVIEVDHVIVTVSLGVLKEKHFTLFDPKLPAEKIRAIERTGFGTVNKMFLEFSTPFWSKNWPGFAILWRKEDLKEILGTNRAWLKDVLGFFPVKYQPRILDGIIVGPGARHMETLPKDEVLSGCMYLLQKFLKIEIPTPVNIKTSKWYTNENFRGSYSNRSIKAEEVNAKPSHLASPLTISEQRPVVLFAGEASNVPSPLASSEQRPVVLFAGEATNDNHFATVHGAVETGWREAQRLAEFYKNN